MLDKKQIPGMISEERQAEANKNNARANVHEVGQNTSLLTWTGDREMPVMLVPNLLLICREDPPTPQPGNERSIRKSITNASISIIISVSTSTSSTSTLTLTLSNNRYMLQVYILHA